MASLVLLATARCGTPVVASSTSAEGGGAGVSSSTASMGSSSGGCSVAPPLQHRAMQTTCAPSVPDGDPYPPCTKDADCQMPGFMGPLMGKCVTTATGQSCDFNQCSTDSSCPDPTDVCVCQGQFSGGLTSPIGSICVAGNCHTDADCKPGGYCSPSVDFACGLFNGGLFCHTCADTCVDDADCPPDPSKGTGHYCAFDRSVGHWACGYTDSCGI